MCSVILWLDFSDKNIQLTDIERLQVMTWNFRLEILCGEVFHIELMSTENNSTTCVTSVKQAILEEWQNIEEYLLKHRVASSFMIFDVIKNNTILLC